MIKTLATERDIEMEFKKLFLAMFCHVLTAIKTQPGRRHFNRFGDNILVANVSQCVKLTCVVLTCEKVPFDRNRCFSLIASYGRILYHWENLVLRIILVLYFMKFDPGRGQPRCQKITKARRRARILLS